MFSNEKKTLLFSPDFSFNFFLQIMYWNAFQMSCIVVNALFLCNYHQPSNMSCGIKCRWYQIVNSFIEMSCHSKTFSFFWTSFMWNAKLLHTIIVLYSSVKSKYKANRVLISLSTFGYDFTFALPHSSLRVDDIFCVIFFKKLLWKWILDSYDFKPDMIPGRVRGWNFAQKILAKSNNFLSF